MLGCEDVGSRPHSYMDFKANPFDPEENYHWENPDKPVPQATVR
jgi:hypothetical protein